MLQPHIPIISFQYDYYNSPLNTNLVLKIRLICEVWWHQLDNAYNLV